MYNLNTDSLGAARNLNSFSDSVAQNVYLAWIVLQI